MRRSSQNENVYESGQKQNEIVGQRYFSGYKKYEHRFYEGLQNEGEHQWGYRETEPFDEIITGIHQVWMKYSQIFCFKQKWELIKNSKNIIVG